MVTDYDKMGKADANIGTNVPVEAGPTNKVGDKPGGYVVKGKPRKVKKSLWSKIISALIGSDGGRGVLGTVRDEIVAPTLRKMLYDSICAGAGMLINEDHSYRPNYSNNNGGGARQYNRNYSGYSQPVQRRANGGSYGRRYRIDSILFEDRNEALDVLREMEAYISEYGFIRVSDVYEMCRLETNYTDFNFGWSDLTGAKVTGSTSGWELILPPTEPVNNG